MNKMGQKIRSKRLEYNLTMEELAEKIGANKSSISKWESGEVANIKRTYILKMAQVFHCKPSWLMDMDDASEVMVTYTAEGKESVTLEVEQEPIMGAASQLAILYSYAAKIKPENIPAAIEVLKSLT